MKRCEPAWAKDFHCIAGACSDTCCAGWEVTVDEESRERYMRVEGPFGERLRRELRQEEGEYYFALTPDHRCPFLNKDNLCDIYIHLGEEALCDICTQHPRFYNWFGNYTEQGIGLCCEEAQRLMFSDPPPMRFILEDDDEDPLEENETGEDLAALLAMRQEGFAILQDRSYSIEERLDGLTAYFTRVQQALDGEPENGQIHPVGDEAVAKGDARAVSPAPDKAAAEQLLDLFHGLDYLDARWSALLGQTRENLDQILTEGLPLLQADEDRAYEWEHLAVYLLYRYLPESLYDGEILLRARFAVTCVRLLRLMAGGLYLKDGYSEKDRDSLLRLFSREIEYCPENLEAVLERL